MLSRVILTLSLVVRAAAQTVGSTPVAVPAVPPFESLSLHSVPASEVNRITPLRGGPGTDTPTRITMFAPASALFEEAFGVPLSRIGNLDKGYVTPGVFELTATLKLGTTREEYRAMLRELLTERFQLRYHRQFGEGPVYHLGIDPAGLKIKPTGEQAGESGADATRRARAAATPARPRRSGANAGAASGDGTEVSLPPGKDVGPISYGQGRWALQRIGITMEEFARLMEGEVRYPVVDKTGLKGGYDIALRWTKVVPGTLPRVNAGETLFVPALRSQLGLTVTLSRGPWEYVIIDGMAERLE